MVKILFRKLETFLDAQSAKSRILAAIEEACIESIKFKALAFHRLMLLRYMDDIGKRSRDPLNERAMSISSF